MINNRILLIDDDQSLLDALASFLILEKFQVKTVVQSTLVREIISKYHPDLIILDIDLGNADGRSICDELKRTPEYQHLPIILLTALSYDEISAIDCMADAIIGKPFETSMLLFNIRALL